jgi:uncharacterized protein (DUF1697 family)
VAVLVSLFRAINVGGRNGVKMTELKAMHEAMGLKKVTTLLQTGNVVFERDAAEPDELAAQIAMAFEQQFGFHSDVMVRTPAELEAVIDKNPFPDHNEQDRKWLLVMFLTAVPDEQAANDLLSSYTGPEKMVVVGKELYIFYGEGMGRSKLTNALIEKKLKVRGTGRNLNTVIKLLDMARRSSSKAQGST